MKNAWIILIAILLMPRYGFGQTITATPLWQTLPVEPPMLPADQSGLAPVNDIKLYYAVFNKNGKDPVMLLHGGFGSSDVWGFEVPLLCKTHQVIVVDNRGHGRSTMSGQSLNYDLKSADVLQLMDFLHIEKAIPDSRKHHKSMGRQA
ncbi:alpha/beta fold hydrolase [Mucilaginibacter lappiensis]|uniref:alpha/beta fold hydrolase n=1 Tax=Mucilaginibacter lappiensis TaxID=354630 RepID=UPI003D1E3914